MAFEEQQLLVYVVWQASYVASERRSVKGQVEERHF